MSGDLARTIAFAFRRKGAQRLTRTDLMMTLAMDLRWLSPDGAKRAIDAAARAGLLALDGDALVPSFPLDAIEMPLNFRPSESVWEEVESYPTLPPPAAPAPPADADAEAERAARGGLVSLDVARLIVARRRGEDVAARAAELEAKLLRSSPG